MFSRFVLKEQKGMFYVPNTQPVGNRAVATYEVFRYRMQLWSVGWQMALNYELKSCTNEKLVVGLVNE